VRLEGFGKLKKILSPHRVSNLRPSGLWPSASTTTLPRAMLIYIYTYIHIYIYVRRVVADILGIMVPEEFLRK
jgi:hypothetical protein